ncbi:hypothetical protein OPIT5_27325 [Opitutaceae bacterium TAV5]|nr:hypothetical protein OPIT5_27325 [Opitutaceae bacterium TAV5]
MTATVWRSSSHCLHTIRPNLLTVLMDYAFGIFTTLF